MCYERTLFHFFTYPLPEKDLARSGTELGHRTKNDVTMRTQHHIASHHLAPPPHGIAPPWLIDPPMHRPFIYKEMQIRVAIKTLYITLLGLQPSVGLYSYSNVHTCVSPLIPLLALVVVFWTIRPKTLLGLDVDINTWLFTLPLIEQRHHLHCWIPCPSKRKWLHVHHCWPCPPTNQEPRTCLSLLQQNLLVYLRTT